MIAGKKQGGGSLIRHPVPPGNVEFIRSPHFPKQMMPSASEMLSWS
jgi:hypothetical protein